MFSHRPLTKQQNVKLIQIEKICKQQNASHKSRVVLVRVNLEETEKNMVMSIFALSCSVFRRLFLWGRESRDSLVKSSGPSTSSPADCVHDLTLNDKVINWSKFHANN